MAREKSAEPSEMVDISAEQSLEYYKDTKLYVARGKARAVKGDMVVEADLLTAHQRDGAKDSSGKGAGSIDQLTAEGNVVIRDPKQQVYGQRAVYDMDEKTIKITGSNLKYITQSDIVTAQDSLEYYEDRKVAVARGRAIGEHDGSRIQADTLSAHFTSSPTGQMEMSQMFAKGHVIITTKDGGVSRGQEAVYNVKKNVAVLSQNVRVTRGQTQLAGDKAEIDFATGQSRLINSGSGRVRALLPTSSDSGKKKETP